MARRIEGVTLLRFAAVVLCVAVSAAGLNCSGGGTSPSPTTPTPTPAPARSSAQVTVLDETTTVSLTGTVSNSSGERIPGAIVTILDGENAGKRTGTTSNGEYQFDGLTAANGNLSATATFYAEQRGGLYIDGTNTLNFTLSRAIVPLVGKVSSSSGTAISGATVKVLDGPNKDDKVTTHTNGDYRFSSLTAGDINFSASATGYQTGFRGVSVNGVNSLNFSLTPAEVAPSVSISATLVIGGAGIVPQEWEFVATLTGNPTITHYDWSFGDGSSASETVAKERHLYGRKGTYTVRVVAVRPSGGNLEAEKEITIE